ncbi:hypothetical protein [Marinoscillum pacificum]|uniref:hypothetical protein n=1 Tax=Marinoscillum pacificum TaxID=392723 RepID=UPI00215865FB|nr:hypothetical protein [Marinoscillum pacificum]
MIRYCYLFAFLLVHYTLQAQNIAKEEQNVLQLVASDSTVQEYLATYVDFDEVTIGPQQEFMFYKDDITVVPVDAIKIKKVNQKVDGLYKVKITINNEVAITTKIVYLSERNHWRKSIFARDKNWLFGDGEMYYVFDN